MIATLLYHPTIIVHTKKYADGDIGFITVNTTNILVYLKVCTFVCKSFRLHIGSF